MIEPIAYWISVRDAHDECRYFTSYEDLLIWVSDEGEYQAEWDVIEVIERRADGTVIRHDRDTVDAWSAERDEDIETEREHERWLSSPQLTGRI